jgi:hypothetical protein
MGPTRYSRACALSLLTIACGRTPVFEGRELDDWLVVETRTGPCPTAVPTWCDD